MRSIRLNAFHIASCGLLLGLPAARAEQCFAQYFPEPLTSPWVSPASHYGSAVAASGTMFAVGAPDDNQAMGSVVIHELANGSFGSSTVIQPLFGMPGDRFGAAVALDGDRLVVGAPMDNAAGVGTGAGAIYVYHRIVNQGTSAWIQDAKFYAPDAAPGDHFGAVVAASGNTILIGAPDRDGLAVDQGRAYALEYSVNSLVWSTFNQTTPQTNEHYGSALSIDGNLLAIGSPHYIKKTPSTPEFGRVTVLSRSAPGSNWLKESELVPATGVAGLHFGISVSVKSGRILVGAPGFVDSSGLASGAGLLFEKQNGTWTQVTDLSSYDALFNGETLLGTAVVLLEHDVIIASPTRLSTGHQDIYGQWWVPTGVSLPFGDMQVNDGTTISPIIAASGSFAIAGRPAAAPGEVDKAFALSLCAGNWSNHPWAASKGVAGYPQLRGAGPLDDNLALELRLEKAKPNTFGMLLVHVGIEAALPFHGGTLEAFPANLALTVPIDNAGRFAAPAVLPAGLSNVSFVMQMLIPDATAKGGVALSTGLKATTAP